MCDKPPYSIKELFYAGSKQKFDVHKINVDNIVFNKYNGRIGTFVKGYEKNSGELDPTNENDEKLIIDFLWKSNEPRNKETMKDIKAKEQLEPGIISADGVIVDGNRRAMLLKKIAQERNDTPTYFIAAVLEENLGDNPKEITKLETMEQMGQDAKVDYNPIEKYVKCKDLKDIHNFTNKQIAKMFGDPEDKIEEYFEILDLMDDYLDNHLKDNDEEESSYSEMYTVLSQQKREGPFVDLNRHLKKHKAGTAIGKDWEYQPEEIDEAKSVFFDYVRAGFGSQQDIRYITDPKKDHGIFTKKNIWDKFSDEHFNIMENIEEKSVLERREENPNADVIQILLARDKDFQNFSEKDLRTNLKQKKRDLEDATEESKPYELIQQALNKLLQIDDNADFSDDAEYALKTIKDINKILWELQKPLEKKIK